MKHSKWSYIMVGASFMGAVLGAVIHSAVLLGLNVFFVVWNWYIAEAKRQLEEEALIRNDSTDDDRI